MNSISYNVPYWHKKEDNITLVISNLNIAYNDDKRIKNWLFLRNKKIALYGGLVKKKPKMSQDGILTLVLILH